MIISVSNTETYRNKNEQLNLRFLPPSPPTLSSAPPLTTRTRLTTTSCPVPPMGPRSTLSLLCKAGPTWMMRDPCMELIPSPFQAPCPVTKPLRKVTRLPLCRPSSLGWCSGPLLSLDLCTKLPRPRPPPLPTFTMLPGPPSQPLTQLVPKDPLPVSFSDLRGGALLCLSSTASKFGILNSSEVIP